MDPPPVTAEIIMWCRLQAYRIGLYPLSLKHCNTLSVTVKT
jgi:hypothetical protein